MNYSLENFFRAKEKSSEKCIMEVSEYVRQLDYEARKHYMAKLDVVGERFPDPYNLREDQLGRVQCHFTRI